MGEAFISGLIGSICSLIAIWIVFYFFLDHEVVENIYIAVAIAGFFSAFFANMCTKKSPKSD